MDRISVVSEISALEKSINNCQGRILRKSSRKLSGSFSQDLNRSPSVGYIENIENSFQAKQTKFNEYLKLSNIETQQQTILSNLLRSMETDENPIDISAEISQERDSAIEKINNAQKEIASIELEIQEYLSHMKKNENCDNGTYYVQIMLVIVGLLIAIQFRNYFPL